MSSPIGPLDPNIRIPGFLSRSQRNDHPSRDAARTGLEPELPPASSLDDYAGAKHWESQPQSDARDAQLLGHLATVLQDRLCEIAHLIVKLTYTDMITFAQGTAGDPVKIIEWSRTYIENSTRGTK